MNHTIARLVVWAMRTATAALVVIGLWLLVAPASGLVLLGLGLLVVAGLAFWLQHTVNWLYPVRREQLPIRRPDGTIDASHPANAGVLSIMLHSSVASQDSPDR